MPNPPSANVTQHFHREAGAEQVEIAIKISSAMLSRAHMLPESAIIEVVRVCNGE
jgi:hypothetical protein